MVPTTHILSVEIIIKCTFSIEAVRNRKQILLSPRIDNVLIWQSICNQICCLMNRWIDSKTSMDWWFIHLKKKEKHSISMSINMFVNHQFIRSPWICKNITKTEKKSVLFFIVFFACFFVVFLIRYNCIYGNKNTLGMERRRSFSTNFLDLYCLIKSIIHGNGPFK